MKISMVDPSLFTPRYDDGLCEALAARGHDVTLLGRPMRDTDAIVPKRYRYDARFFRLGERLRPFLGDGRASQAIKAIEYAFHMRFSDPSLLTGEGGIAHFQWLPFATADSWLIHRAAEKMALVHTVHNSRPYHGDARSGIQGRGYDALLQQFDVLIVHGEQTLESLLRQGIDPRAIQTVSMPPMRLREATAADLAEVPQPAVPRVLFFGTIRPYKGLDFLIQACLDLWRDGLDFELAIAGKPFMPMEPFLAAIRGGDFTERLITDLGFLTEQRLDAHLRAADIIVFPYREIDSSAAFLSSLGYGAALVTSDAGMFGELPEGVASRFPAGRIDGLKIALRQLLVDERRRKAAGMAALRYEKNSAGWRKASELTEQAYDMARVRFAARTGRTAATPA